MTAVMRWQWCNPNLHRKQRSLWILIGVAVSWSLIIPVILLQTKRGFGHESAEEARNDDSLVTVSFVGLEGLNNLTRAAYGIYDREAICTALQQGRTIEEFRSQSTRVNVSFRCRDAFYGPAYGGTGNHISALYALRLAAQTLGSTDVKIECHDAFHERRDLVLPWMMGEFPRITNRNPQSGDTGPTISEVCRSVSNGAPLGRQLEDIVFELRRMAIGLVGIPSLDHPSGRWAEENLWLHPSSVVKYKYQLPHPSKNALPLFPESTLDDVVLHLRCGDIVHVRHPKYGLMKFRSYARHISKNAKTIGIVTQPYQGKSQNRMGEDTAEVHQKCKQVIDAFVNYLAKQFPGANVNVRNDSSETIALTFARMIMANQTVIGQSSFSVFPAIATFGQSFIQRPNATGVNNWLLEPSFVGGKSVNLIDEPMLSSPQIYNMWGKDGQKVMEWLISDPDTQSDSSRGSQPADTYHDDPLRPCTQNPYHHTLDVTLEEAGRRMDQWLANLPRILESIQSNATLHQWDHARFSVFDANVAKCTQTDCIGGPCKHDLSKIVCDLDQLKGEKDCVIYSIGSNNQWTFELDALDKTPCQIHTFDCTGNTTRFRKPENDRLFFHHVCLGTSNEEAPVSCIETEKCGETWTLHEMQAKLGHTRIDLLKADIEGWEWPLFESWPLLTDRAVTTVLPMQVLVEIHYRTQFQKLRPAGVETHHDFKSPIDLANLHARLINMGYAVVVNDNNIFCRHCTELTLLRIRCPSFSNSLKTVVDNGASNSIELAVNPNRSRSAIIDRVNSIQAACGTLCSLNSVEEMQKFSVDVPNSPLPMVVVKDVNCRSIFENEEIDASDNSAPPIPADLLPLFTLNNAYPLRQDSLRRDIYLGGQAYSHVWREDDINQAVQQAIDGTLDGTYHIIETNYVRNILSRLDLHGKHILVIGSERPWLEAVILSLGAARVTTLEYGMIKSQHPKVDTLTPENFRDLFLRGLLPLFDGVASHSSLEHSGLGRYGDALNPWGDILAIARAWCTTKPGGFLYLGLPTGKDLIYSNWHRVYGRLRWPLVTTNWKPLDSTYGSEFDSINYVHGGGGGGYGRIFEKH